jgi:hypothetical protein
MIHHHGVPRRQQGQSALRRCDCRLSRPSSRGDRDEKAVLAALDEGLCDEDGTVKAYAIEALAELREVGAMASLRMALRDSDPSMQMRGIESVPQTEEGLLCFQEAFADADATMRALVAHWLGQVGSEGL